jgi:hypothetical protein
MKIAKNREQCTETSNLGGKQEHEAPFFILIFIFLSNSGFNVGFSNCQLVKIYSFIEKLAHYLLFSFIDAFS